MHPFPAPIDNTLILTEASFFSPVVQARASSRVKNATKLCLLFTLFATCLPMTAQVPCTISQITETPAISPTGGTIFNVAPSISGNGRHIAFVSNANLSGNNADGNSEIFLFDGPSGTFSQITKTTGGGDVAQLSLSHDGDRVVFASSRNLTGGNSDGNFEIFLFDARSGTITQVTHTSPPVGEAADNSSPAISDDGRFIVFASSHDLTGNNPDGNSEVFLFDIAAGAFTQITSAAGGITGGPTISAHSQYIAFVSDRNLTGNDPDGNLEIFRFNTSTRTLTQLTNTSGGINNQPSINGNGKRIAFSSDRDLTGGNGDENAELFMFDATTGAFTQVTNTTGISPVGSFNIEPRISGNGQRIAFVSDRNLTGSNLDENPEIFLFDTSTGAFTQITNTSGFSGSLNSAPSISQSGNYIAFLSGFDLVGRNADGNAEIFLARCAAEDPSR